ncbi:GumC family protein [Terriglobus albidus]|uniref:GumC family protein n=1 Tax=Terriglobus albidus TaxID=1592106 RepID=UPI0021DFBF05|nr:polysaccharide biosynthesis tyrosine autokinase [Terriglobus albidus]
MLTSETSGSKSSPHVLRQQQTHDLQLLDVWKFLVRQRTVIAICALLGVVAGCIAYVRAPRQYTSSATVEMNRDATSGLGLQDLSGAGSALGIGQDFMTDMLTQQAVLMSDNTALSVIDRLHLDETEPFRTVKIADKGSNKNYVENASIREKMVSIFKTRLQAVPVKNTRLIRVFYTDTDPDRAAKVANTVVEAYLANHTRTRYEATSKASEWLTKQLEDLKIQAEKSHEQVAKLEQESGILTLSSPTSGNSQGGQGESVALNPDYQQLLVLSQELSQAELLRIQQETAYRLAQTSEADALLEDTGARGILGKENPLALDSENMQLIRSLRAQQLSLETKISAEQVRYGARNPVIIELQKQLQSIKEQLAAEIGRVKESAKRSYELALRNEHALQQEVDKQRQHVSAIGNQMAALAFLREEELTSRRLYQDLYTRLEEANIAAGVRSSGMAVVDPARPSSRKSSPILKSDIGAGLAAGLMCGIFIAAFRQVRDNTLNIPEDFEERSPFPMLGVIPGFESGGSTPYDDGKESDKPIIDDKAWILRLPKSQVSEAYRQIRTSLLLASIDSPPKVIQFTSPLSGDGKSTTAYNLSVAFAAQSSRVLIIDADMRRPSIRKISQIEEPRGLSEVLSGASTFAQVVQQHPHLPSLHILLAGATPPDPAELLGSKRFASLIEDLKGQYDYIMVDVPPVLLVTDPVVTSTIVDAVVIVVRAGKTTKPALRRLWSSLDNPTIKVLGFVVNDFNRRLQSFAYGYEGYKASNYYYYSRDSK